MIENRLSGRKAIDLFWVAGPEADRSLVRRFMIQGL